MILIALGANLSSMAGPPEATFRAAAAALEEQGDIRLTLWSRIYRSPAWPDPSEPEFRNAVAALETALLPATLLARLHETEARFGRRRDVAIANAPRPLDLDLLDCDGQVSGVSPLLPHPRIHERAFVLLPLQDVAPQWRHPISGLSVASLLADLPQGLMRGVVPV